MDVASMNRNIAVLTSYFNPCQYRRTRDNYERFVAGIRSNDVRVQSIELAFDDDPFEIADATYQIRGNRHRHQL